MTASISNRFTNPPSANTSNGYVPCRSWIWSTNGVSRPWSLPDRVTATATYSYDLTEVVSADIGYRFRSRREDPTDAQSNAVFFQIGRTFETIP